MTKRRSARAIGWFSSIVLLLGFVGLAESFACLARLANADGLAMASSDRLFRSSVTPAAFSPLINCP